MILKRSLILQFLFIPPSFLVFLQACINLLAVSMLSGKLKGPRPACLGYFSLVARAGVSRTPGRHAGARAGAIRKSPRAHAKDQPCEDNERYSLVTETQ